MGCLPTWAKSGVKCWVKILLHFLISLSLLSSFQMGAMGINSNETDRLALLAFKAKITDDPKGIMSLWNDTVHLCEWYGVTCGIRHQRVTQLSLISLKLGGSVSPHVGNLSFLQVLQLQNNSFIGQIPPQIGLLRRLQELNLINNTFGGEIPLNLRSCSELERLILSNNQLEGKIPSELGSLSKLQFFAVSKNNLAGVLPPSLGNLSFLEDFRVAVNNLAGQIPESFGNLRYLSNFYLGFNNMHGEVPSSLFNISSMEAIDIGGNLLGGHLPPDMFNTLPNLQYLSVGLNRFHGPVPGSLSNASNLQALELSVNNFTGGVPSLERITNLWAFLTDGNQLGGEVGALDDLSFLCSLTNTTTLSLLQIDTNNFRGVLPPCIANLSSQLTRLSMFSNYISGSIPPGIDNLIGLEQLSLSINSLTGSIPPSIGNLKNIVQLYLDGNSLSGIIPPSLGKLSSLNQIDLSSNSLEGEIPSSLQNCTFLQAVGLNHNNLTGSIPIQVLNIQSLSLYLLVSHNQLTGSLPEEIGNLKNLYKLDVSANMLSGNIPDSLSECTSMVFLGLGSNNFQGHIPSSLSSMKGFQLLDLSSNNLSGQIPVSLASLDLIMLNLSFNDLEGMVPNGGLFKNATAVSLTGNNKLCGGVPALHLPGCSTPTWKKKKISTKTKVIISTLGVLASAASLILLLFVYQLWRRKRRQTREALVAEPSSSLQLVSYGDLHRATNGFSEGHLVGAGSFGHVYRGILGEGGQVVAIKVLNLDNHGASKSFVSECEALRNIRHRNLVKLLTVCSGIDYQGNEFKALIYEYMPNGSLDDWLRHPVMTEDEAAGEQAPSRKLGLLERLSIASDVASLLKYVHHEFGSPLIHCDIKPSNILLDADLLGHVSDFGLSKFLLDSGIISNSVHASLSSIGVRGTVGYAPPEYGLGSEVSTQGDVYSYGILMLEMFTGKRPTHEMFKEGLNLHLYAKMGLPSGLLGILDPTLHDLLISEGSVLNPRRSERVMECLVLVIEIGVACSQESPSKRMEMGEVKEKLNKIKDNLFGGRN